MSGQASIGPAQVLAGVESQLCSVLRARSRPPARVAAQFEDREVSTFLPLLTEFRRRSDCRKQAPFPPTEALLRLTFFVETRVFLLRTADVANLREVESQESKVENDASFELPFLTFNFQPFARLRAGLSTFDSFMPRENG
jgi:hypothetical protein